MIHSSNTIEQVAETAQWFHPYLVHESNHKTKDLAHLNISTLNEHRSDSQTNISLVYQALQSLHPSAGPRYWSARCWSVLYWQLVYINLASVHKLQLPIKTHSIVQHAKSSSVYGYHIDPSFESISQQVASEEALISTASMELIDSLEKLFEQCVQTFKFSHKKAFRLVAASVINALTTLFNKLDATRAWDLSDIANEWLSGMSLQGEASLIVQNNKIQTIRKACCMHYLIEPNNGCDDCPRTQKKH